MTTWEVLAESDRHQWVYQPLVGVGPLRFGMSFEQAAAALDEWTATVTPAHRSAFEGDQRAGFRTAGSPSYRLPLTAYFGDSEGIVCVVADALCGPQVSLDGIPLVGRVPSQLDAALRELMLTRGTSPQYFPEGDIGADEWGLVIQVQRAGDVLLTRPVLAVVRQRAYTVWDGMPYDELEVH
ncbi:hypothetical protein [Plantactinospora endophytica]|uniref:Uncharacterized protein n=1 Tax=Plantactinospora endophytica TaxID=673535 RepID=A0ABQ4EGN1_9ACTN|nr:hypothetical protein [Plantactinospora endophytica]GIG93377.1 hypothetical protein Pen02_83130 [Plantactinospora endophytica]